MNIYKNIIYFLIIILLFANSTIQSSEVPEGLRSKNILFHNTESDLTIYQRNAYERVYPASITKIVTYIIAYENLEDKNVMIVADPTLLRSLDGTQSSLANLKPGNSYTADQLLKSMMICSGNDSALILANYVGGNGGVSNFVRMMNEKVKNLGCKNTKFTNPHGLHNPEHYSTCYDLLKIIKYALKIDEFRSTVKTQYFYLDGNKVTNTNKLIDPENSKYYFRHCYGIKTGSHNAAGFCLSSIAGNKNGNYICICLGAPMYDNNGNKLNDNYAMLDSKKLYDWAFNNYKIVNFPLNMLKYPLVRTKAFNVVIDLEVKPFSILIPNGMRTSDIQYKFDIPDFIEASTIDKGTNIGSLSLYVSPDISKRVEVCTKKSLSVNFYQRFIWLLSFI